MRNILALLTCLWFLPITCSSAQATESPFNDETSFQTAYSVKLGAALGEMDKPNKTGVEKGTLCETDADCRDNEKCKLSACVNVCDPDPCSSGYCLIEGNHSYSCVACLTNDHCSADKKCSGNACVDACSGNNCASKSQLCSSDGNHGYRCYGCTSDSACSNNEYCDTTTKTCRTLCPDSCSGNLICTVTGSHKASCTCESDANCPEKQKCDLETKQCVTACQYTPEVCAQEIGGTAEDWYIKETDEGCECATDKKYVLMADMKPDCNGASYYNLHRIKAVKDFGNIKKGTLGGYIEKESNLSQTGNAWVGCDSRGCAWVTGNAKVYGNALVEGAGKTNMRGEYDYYCGATRVSNDAEIYGDAKVLAGSEIFAGKVYGRAVFHGIGKYPGTSEYPEVFAKGSYYTSSMSLGGEVYDDAQIYLGGYVGGAGSASANKQKVHGHAIVAGGKPPVDERSYIYYSADVSGNAKIIGGAEISGNAKVYGNAVVDGGQVSGNAQVYDNAKVGKKGYVQGRAKLFGNAVFDPGSSSSRGLPYLCGTASLSGTAKVTSVPESNKNAICKNSYTSGSPAWQESYCSSKNCPQ